MSPGSVNLGPARAGLFAVRYSQSGATKSTTLLLLPVDVQTLEIVPPDVKPTLITTGDRALADRLGSAVTQTRLSDPAGRTFPGWIAANGASIGANGVVCLLVVPLPTLGGQCVLSTFSLGLSLLTEFLKQLVDVCVVQKVFTQSDGNRLKILLTATNTLTEVILGSSKFGKTLSVVVGTVEVATSSATWQISVKYGLDATEKYYSLIELQK